jgi:hypothetical protein
MTPGLRSAHRSASCGAGDREDGSARARTNGCAPGALHGRSSHDHCHECWAIRLYAHDLDEWRRPLARARNPELRRGALVSRRCRCRVRARRQLCLWRTLEGTIFGASPFGCVGRPPPHVGRSSNRRCVACRAFPSRQERVATRRLPRNGDLLGRLRYRARSRAGASSPSSGLSACRHAGVDRIGLMAHCGAVKR